MPREARIDTPGALHHIIIRGIERRRVFYDDSDRDRTGMGDILDLLLHIYGLEIILYLLLLFDNLLNFRDLSHNKAGLNP
jgi:REP element-mobilizing transposase RayT